jgi:glycosyltransferase involved in cell wall biosynthesis
VNLAIITNILTPFRIPLFEALRQRVGAFKVLLMAESEENRQWKLDQVSFQTQVLPGLHFKPHGYDVSVHVNHGVIRALRAFAPDIVVNAGFAPANMVAFLYCKLLRKKVLCWAHLRLEDGAQVSLVRKLIRYMMIRGSDGAIAESSDACDAFRHYGARPDRVLTSLIPIDAQRLREQTQAFRISPQCLQLRARFSGPVILSIGQAIPRKGYHEMFLIYERLLTQCPTASLVLLGDGPERARHEQLALERGWRNVHFEGYVQAEELYPYLAVSDVFVFHTLYDPFGLVLSEAMAAGVPVVSSIHASSTRDLVTDGVTGFRLDPKDIEASAGVVLRVLAMSPAERHAMTEAAHARVEQCHIPIAAERMTRFFETVLGRERQGPDAAPRSLQSPS